MSSNSSGEPRNGDSVEQLVRRSVVLMGVESPDDLAEVVRAGAGISVAIEVDGERFAVVFDEHGVDVLGGEQPTADVRVATDRATIAGVLAGHEPIQDAILADRLRVIGELAVVVIAYDALVAFVRGAITSTAQERLYGRFMGSAAQG